MLSLKFVIPALYEFIRSFTYLLHCENTPHVMLSDTHRIRLGLNFSLRGRLFTAGKVFLRHCGVCFEKYLGYFVLLICGWRSSEDLKPHQKGSNFYYPYLFSCRIIYKPLKQCMKVLSMQLAIVFSFRALGITDFSYCVCLPL